VIIDDHTYIQSSITDSVTVPETSNSVDNDMDVITDNSILNSTLMNIRFDEVDQNNMADLFNLELIKEAFGSTENNDICGISEHNVANFETVK